MSSEYNLSLKATLDTSEVQQKLQQLGQTGANVNAQIEQSVQKLDKSIKDLNQSLTKSAQQQAAFGSTLKAMTRGAGAALVGQVIQSGGRLAATTGHENIAAGADYAGAALKGAGAGAAIGSMVPVVGTTVGAAVGAAAGLASKALDNLTASAEKAAKVMEDIAKLESVNAEMFEQEALRRQMEERVPNMSSSDLEARRKFLSQDVQEYQDFLMKNQKRLDVPKKWSVSWSTPAWNNWTGISLKSVPDEKKMAEQAQLRLEQSQTLKKQADAAQREIDAINKELESRGVGLDAREDLNEAIAEETRLLKEAAQRESDAWNKAAAAANDEVKAQEELEAKQKAEGEAAIKKAQADFEAAQLADEATAFGATGLLGDIEAARASDQFENFLKTANVSELLDMKQQMKDASEQLGQSAYLKATQAQSIGGAEGATLLAEAQDEWVRAREAQSRLDAIESALGGNLPSIQDSMRALGSEAQKGYDVGGYGNIDQQILKVEQETKDVTKQSANTLRNIETKMTEMKNVLTQGGGIAATW